MTEKKKRGRPRKNQPRKCTQIIPFRDIHGWLWQKVLTEVRFNDRGKSYVLKSYPKKELIFCPETNGLRALIICNNCELRSKRKSKKGVICWSQSTKQPPQYYNRYNKDKYARPTNTPASAGATNLKTTE